MRKTRRPVFQWCGGSRPSYDLRVPGLILWMDNVGVVVDDLEAAVALFVELGLELEGQAVVEERWAQTAEGSMRRILAMNPG